MLRDPGFGVERRCRTFYTIVCRRVKRLRRNSHVIVSNSDRYVALIWMCQVQRSASSVKGLPQLTVSSCFALVLIAVTTGESNGDVSKSGF